LRGLATNIICSCGDRRLEESSAQHAPAPQAGVQPHQVLKAPDLLCSIADSFVHFVAVPWAGRISGLSSGILDLPNMEAVKMTLDLEPISVGS